MGEGLLWDVCLVVLHLMRVVSTTDNTICAELEFGGLHSEDKIISVKENSFVNLTFYFKTNGCQPLVDTFHVKVSYQEKGFVTDLCNVFFHPHCNVSDLSSPCRCLSSCCAQFFKIVNQSDGRTYTWTWFSLNRERKEQREIEIHVIGTSNTTDYKVVIILSSVGMVVAGSSVAVCIFWIRTKYKAEVNVDDTEDYSSEFDCVSDDFVNRENEESPDETYNHLNTH